MAHQRHDIGRQKRVAAADRRTAGLIRRATPETLAWRLVRRGLATTTILGSRPAPRDNEEETNEGTDNV